MRTARPGPVLADLRCHKLQLGESNGDTSWEFNLYFDPATGIKETGFAPDGPRKLLQITGDFDDPSAKDCVLPAASIGERTATRLTCWTHFAVDKVT